jgi:hypothetical protein
VSLLFQVVFASACRGTHHRLALDALRHLRGPDSERWTDLFLHYHARYLAGSKAPDNQFKDFQNHVLHVGENYWGGAPAAARRWYGTLVDALRREVWPDAVYAAGVLSHYFSDPFMPLHTGQTEGEAAVHRALEWSISKCYGELQQILDYDRGGYPRVEAPRRDDWLTCMIRQGAELAHEHYQAVIDHYDLAKGIKQPTAGMDQECKDRIAECLGAAVVGVARVLERAFEEAAVEPPNVEITLQGFLATLAVPIRYVVNQLHDMHERLVVEAIYDEVQRTGKVLQNLPEDDRVVRQMHADEVLKVPLRDLDARPADPAGTKHGTGALPREMPNRLIATPVIDNRSGSARLLRYRPVRIVDAGARIQGSGFRVQGSGFRSARSQETGNRSQETGNRSQEPVARSQGPGIRSQESEARSQEAGVRSQETAASSQEPVVSSQELGVSVPDRQQSEIRNPQSEIPFTLRFRLSPESPVVDAPSIGAKTAERLQRAGIRTVAELLAAEPDPLAARVSFKHVTPQNIRAWQAEARLACTIPEIHGHDAQILAASGLTEPSDLAALEPREVLEMIAPFVQSTEGQRILRSSAPPDLDEVTNWVAWARQARPLKAA